MYVIFFCTFARLSNKIFLAYVKKMTYARVYITFLKFLYLLQKKEPLMN